MFYELHVHSTYSDGIPTPREIVEHAKHIGLAGIAITDHNAIEGAIKALKLDAEGLHIIPGVEVSAVEGHILALNVTEVIPRDLSAAETVERIHSLGGLAVAAHPYDRYRHSVGDLILKLEFDAVEVVNAHTFGNKKDPVKTAVENDLKMVGGSDAHTLGEIASVKIGVEGDVFECIKAGEVEIIKDNLPTLLVKHARGLMKRKLRV
jgi:predicted metal-dependent phosphoesterase TrpH